MPTSARTENRGAHRATRRHRRGGPDQELDRIVVGVDGRPEGRDAVVLGAAIERITGAELVLVGVHSAPLLPAAGWDWRSMRKYTQTYLRDVRSSLAPDARLLTRTDNSVARALRRVVTRERCDLLVMGSSPDALDGHVRIGKRTRQLLGHFERAIAIAPRGLQSTPDLKLKRIGVGYDGGPEADAALALAGSLAAAASARLTVTGVVDDRVPLLMRSALDGLATADRRQAIAEEERRLHDRGLATAKATGATVSVNVRRGRPADALLALSNKVDLLVIGSRRWGPATRVLLGSTGEALMRDAACPVLAVPRPGRWR